jgi:hypothetical protein
MLSLFYQLPNCNLFTQHVLFYLGETPLVNCGPRSYFHYIAITCLLYSHCLLSRILLLLSTRYAHTFVWVGSKVLGCVVCRFHVATSWRRTNKNRKWRPCWKSLGQQASPSGVWLFPRYDKHWFLTEGKACCYAHHTFLLGFPTGRWKPSTPCRISHIPGLLNIHISSTPNPAPEPQQPLPLPGCLASHTSPCPTTSLPSTCVGSTGMKPPTLSSVVSSFGLKRLLADALSMSSPINPNTKVGHDGWCRQEPIMSCWGRLVHATMVWPGLLGGKTSGRQDDAIWQ